MMSLSSQVLPSINPWPTRGKIKAVNKMTPVAIIMQIMNALDCIDRLCSFLHHSQITCSTNSIKVDPKKRTIRLAEIVLGIQFPNPPNSSPKPEK